ncbi:MAG: hypothetical protein HQK81_07720 [Desulfovibrionaceae bacterium]|nr:hypothetical protein [Desulfovibrionaceae bacterium]MBF0513938.1 hypothetical protein [Desulfovibrionaceae bacterium]
MDLTFLTEIVERKLAGYPPETNAATRPNDQGDRLDRTVGDLLDGAKGRLSAASLFSLRALLVGAVNELRRHNDNLHAAV